MSLAASPPCRCLWNPSCRCCRARDAVASRRCLCAFPPPPSSAPHLQTPRRGRWTPCGATSTTSHASSSTPSRCAAPAPAGGVGGAAGCCAGLARCRCSWGGASESGCSPPRRLPSSRLLFSRLPSSPAASLPDPAACAAPPVPPRPPPPPPPAGPDCVQQRGQVAAGVGHVQAHRGAGVVVVVVWGGGVGCGAGDVGWGGAGRVIVVCGSVWVQSILAQRGCHAAAPRR